MPARGSKLSKDRPKWQCWCWVCGNEFHAIRSTAICCSAKCKKQRSRYFQKHKQYPTRHPNGHRSRIKHTHGYTISC